MKETKMQWGVIKKEFFVTQDGKEFDDMNAAFDHQEEIFRKGIDLKTTFSRTSFGDCVDIPREMEYIIVFLPQGIRTMLSHQLYLETIYEALKTVNEVKVLGLDENQQPLDMIVVAKRNEVGNVDVTN